VLTLSAKIKLQIVVITTINMKIKKLIVEILTHNIKAAKKANNNHTILKSKVSLIEEWIPNERVDVEGSLGSYRTFTDEARSNLSRISLCRCLTLLAAYPNANRELV
jgi:hypothetical protein